MAAKDTRIPVRVAAEVKADFEEGAALDGLNLSQWFRWLGERRRAEQAGGIPRSAAGALAQLAEEGAFVPGFGLNDDQEDE